MIGGCAKGEGGSALGVHNANTEDNDDVRLGASRGLMSDGIEEQIAELTQLAKSSGQKKPIKHVFASPPLGAEWNNVQWDNYWKLYEKAQGLESCPFSEAIHDKPGLHDRPEHRQRVYLGITSRGTLVRDGNDFIKQEAVSRITEFDTDSALTKGKHNVRAERFVRKLGRDDVADAMITAGLLNGTRAIADLTPENRAQQERTRISKNDVARDVTHAWAASDNGVSFSAALAERGLRLVMGDKCPVVLDAKNGTHGVLKMLSMDARAHHRPTLKAADIQSRLQGMVLPSLEDAKGTAMITAKAMIVPTDTNPKQPPPSVEAPVPLHNEPKGSPEPLQAVAGAGGKDSKSLAVQGGGTFASDVIEGPGEPPGPGAGPLEIQMYRARLMAYEDKKAAAAKAAFQIQQQGGTNNVATTQSQTTANATSANTAGGPITQDGPATSFRPSGTGHRTIQWWDDAAAGGSGQGNGQHDNGDSPEHGRGFEHAGGPDSTTINGEAKPDNRDSGSVDGGAGKPAAAGTDVAADRRAAAAHIAHLAAESRLIRGLAVQHDAIALLKRARLELTPEWRNKRDAHGRIHADRAHIAALLATHPHPDPIDLDPDARANFYASRLSERLRAGGQVSPDDFKLARADGAAHAYAAQRNVERWLARSDVAQAIDNDRLNRAAAKMAAGGDSELAAALKAGSPQQARSILRERERVEELRRKQLERIAELTGKPPNSGPKGE